MNYFLSEEEQMIVDTARQIAQEKMKPVREKYDEEGTFPWDIVKELADAGLCGAYIPEKYGGFGNGNIMNLVLATEELCKVDGGVALCLAATALGTLPIIIAGNEEQKQKYLPKIAAGTVAAFGLTEPSAGSDATGMKTTAVKDGDYYILNGTKCFITNAGDAEVYTVFAKTNPSRGARGISAFILEKGMEGFTFGKKRK